MQKRGQELEYRELRLQPSLLLGRKEGMKEGGEEGGGGGGARAAVHLFIHLRV